MVVHSQAIDHAYDLSLDRAKFHHKKKRGAYLFSADGKERWSLSDWELFPSEIKWDDGTTQFLLKQQRPSLIFDDSTGLPTHLVTGVDFIFDPCCDWYAYGSAWTLVQPLSTCPAGQILDTSSASCVTCSPDENIYFGHCEEATSKYGQCVCAKCEDGYSGDTCEIGAQVRYGMVCGTLQPRHRCANMRGNKKNFPNAQSDPNWCRAKCEEYAESENLSGCCFYISTGKCRFYDGQQTFKPNSLTSAKSSSYCENGRVN